MQLENWNIEEMTGYKPITTFYTDFSIADKFGDKAIIDTYKRAMDNWKNDYKYLTELVMVLNWKAFRYQDNHDLCLLYTTLWDMASNYAENNLNGDELDYYYATTD